MNTTGIPLLLVHCPLKAVKEGKNICFVRGNLTKIYPNRGEEGWILTCKEGSSVVLDSVNMALRYKDNIFD